MGQQYPEFYSFGPFPASGLFIRYANNVIANNTDMKLKKPDSRRTVFTSDVSNLTIEKINSILVYYFY
jgi:hypothetical protein